MTVFLALFRQFWPYILAASVGFGAAWQVQGWRITGLKSEHSAYVIKQTELAQAAEKRALETERKWAKEKEDAINAAAIREQNLKTELDRTRSTSVGLRNTITELRQRVSQAAVEAARQTADTALAILGECEARYGAVAEAADGHASDVKTLEDAWPK